MSVWTPSMVKRSYGWTFQRLERTDGVSPRDVIAKQDYLTIELHGIRIPKMQPSINRFSCVIHSSVLMPSLETLGGNTYFHKIFLPSMLQNVVTKEAGWDLELNSYLLDSVPYRGGRVGIEVEVFCVAPEAVESFGFSGLENACKADHGCFVQQANKSASLAKERLAALIKIDDGACMEAGIQHKCCSPQTGSFVEVGVHRQHLDLSLLKIDPEGHRLVDSNNQTHPYSTIVLSVEASTRRPNWHQIPDIQEVYANLLSARDQVEFDSVHECFKQLCLASPDLQPRDAQRLVSLVTGSFADGSHTRVRRLLDVPLFEDSPADSGMATNLGLCSS